MNLISYLFFCCIISLFKHAQNATPTYIASGRYVSTGNFFLIIGMVDISTTPFYGISGNSNYAGIYTVSLDKYAKSSPSYEIALGLHSFFQ